MRIRFQCTMTIGRLLTVAALVVGGSAAVTRAEIWTNLAGGNWSTTTNWNPNTIPNSIDAVADFSTLNITADRVITVDGASRTVGSLLFGDTTASHNWRVNPSGTTLTLATSAGVPTINVINQTARLDVPLLGDQGFRKLGAGTLQLNSTGPVITGGFSVEAGELGALGNETNAFGNNAVNVFNGATFRVSASANANAVSTREISGAGVLATSAGTNNNTQLRTYVLNDATFSGSAATDQFTINHSGPGTWTLTGSFASGVRGAASGATSHVTNGDLRLAGAATLNNANLAALYLESFGTLTLDNGTSNVNRAEDGLDIFARGGTLRYIGNATSAWTETIERFASAAGTASDINVDHNGQDITLNFTTTFIGGNAGYLGAWNIATDGTLGGNVKVLTTSTHGTLGSSPGLRRVFANGADFAKYDAVNGFMPLAASDYLTPANVNSGGVNNIVLVNNGTATKTLAGSDNFAALKLEGDAAYALDLNGFTLTLGGNSGNDVFQLLKTGAQTVTIQGGQLTANGVSPVDYILRVNEGELNIASQINLPGSNRFVKAGPGVLTLSGSLASATSADIIAFAEGVIRLNPTLPGFSGPQLQFNGGIMEITGAAAYGPTFGTATDNVSLANGGGFAAFANDVNFTTPITWAAANHIGDGRPLLLNSTTADRALTLTGALDLAGSANLLHFREIRVTDNPNVTTDKAVISGQIVGTSNQSHLLKTGGGLLELTNSNNTYLGETYVREGRLNVNGALSAVAAPSHATVTAMDNGTLGGSGAINRPVVAEAGSIVAPGSDIGSLEIGSTFDLHAGSTLAIEIGGANFDLNGNEQYDRLVVAGLTTLAGDLTVSLVNGFDLGASQAFGILDGDGGINGTFANLAEGDTVLSSNGFDLIITYAGLVNDNGAPGTTGGNDVVLYTVSNAAAVPEPATWVLFVVAALASSCVRWRRAQSK